MQTMYTYVCIYIYIYIYMQKPLCKYIYIYIDKHCVYMHMPTLKSNRHSRYLYPHTRNLEAPS